MMDGRTKSDKADVCTSGTISEGAEDPWIVVSDVGPSGVVGRAEERRTYTLVMGEGWGTNKRKKDRPT